MSCPRGRHRTRSRSPPPWDFPCQPSRTGLPGGEQEPPKSVQARQNVVPGSRFDFGYANQLQDSTVEFGGVENSTFATDRVPRPEQSSWRARSLCPASTEKELGVHAGARDPGLPAQIADMDLPMEPGPNPPGSSCAWHVQPARREASRTRAPVQPPRLPVAGHRAATTPPRSGSTHFIRSGRNNAISGKRTRSNRHAAMANQKGNTPLNMVPIGTPAATPFTTNTLIPTGGVISPISITITQITPNQIGSKPSPETMGKTTGSVTTSMARPSKNIPRMT